MNKESAQKYALALKTASSALRQAVAERDDALAKVAQYERRERVTKLASTMIDKGLHDSQDAEKLASHLESLAEQGKLETVEAAVDLAGPDMFGKLASLSADRSNPGGSGSDLERFILTQ